MKTLAGGENRIRIAVIATAIAGILIISSAGFFISDTVPNAPSPYLIYTLVGDISNPSPRYNTTYGFVSPNLWNFQQGKGNTIMYLYSNSSIFTKVNFSNVVQGTPVMAYSSIHFTYELPLSLTNAVAENLSSFVSFHLGQKNYGAFNDFGYDLFLSNNSDLTFEIMILFNMTPTGYTTRYSYPAISIPTLINGIQRSIQWQVTPIVSQTPGVSGGVRFTPVQSLNSSMNCTIDFPFFFRYLESRGEISPSWSIVRLGVGSEYGATYSSRVDYSFWMNAYFVLNGTKYQVVQTSEVG